MLPSYKSLTGWQEDWANGLEKSGLEGESPTQRGTNKAQLGRSIFVNSFNPWMPPDPEISGSPAGLGRARCWLVQPHSAHLGWFFNLSSAYPGIQPQINIRSLGSDPQVIS